ncbi:3-hydroxyisobutyrate dehydrogenase [Amycolatopsis sacchari]|uniref:3-hydroxyisobutyrate dehydrogenase n=1 Tax=Amycolatopsis sacchari TaxID=115433 RepID=A0A1I3L4E8_9PSEU|nr:NAD(P)-dependent oxidoreductase [Amycolatopsis sacchari]SFI79561.1 3-hydroxyisobutyrate dehydrogenase [Amycolatopsis sacchari]
MTRVAFIGLGTMGEPMSRNVAKAGFPLLLHDVDRARAERLAAEYGASVATAVSDFAEMDCVVTMLPTSALVASALTGDWPDGGSVAGALPEGAVVIDMSSSNPLETKVLSEKLAGHGVRLVDAPVSGAVERARAGTLSIMLGADDEDAVAVAVPVIEAMSERIFRTGRVGTGHTMKALNNYVAAAAYTAASEALLAGQRQGLDPQLMVDILNASTGQSFVTTHVLGPHVVQGRHASGFALPLMTKDVGIAKEVTHAALGEAPVCDAVHGRLADALEALGNVDHTLAFEHWKRRAE